MVKLVNLRVNHFSKDSKGFLDHKEVGDYPSVTLGRAMELIADYDTLHDEKKIIMIDFSVQYINIPS